MALTCAPLFFLLFALRFRLRFLYQVLKGWKPYPKSLLIRDNIISVAACIDLCRQQHSGEFTFYLLFV